MGRSALLALAGLLLALPASTHARTWYITPDGTGDAPTIQAGIDSSAAGDTIELACGTYLEYDIEMKPQIAVVGETPGCAVVDAQGFGRVFAAGGGTGILFSGLAIRNGATEPGDNAGGIALKNGEATIMSCTFRDNAAGGHGGAIQVQDATLTITDSLFGGNTGTNGGAIRSLSTDLFLTRCVFDANEAWGTGGVLTTEATNFVTIEDCVFRDNTATYSGAIHASHWAHMQIRQSLFVGNQATFNGGAIYSQNWSEVAVDGCTFWGNGASAGATFYSWGGTIDATHAILAGSTGSAAVHCQEESTISMACCDIFGNAGGDWTGCISGQSGMNGNFSADPFFCDPKNGEFTIRSDSPCAPPGVTGCGLVGALPIGCGPVAVQPWSWGKLKGAYR